MITGFLASVPLAAVDLTCLFEFDLGGETLGFAVTFFFIGQHQRMLIQRKAVLPGILPSTRAGHATLYTHIDESRQLHRGWCKIVEP
jgi:hypothetical protein